MFKRFGKKLIQGAKAEIEEKPIQIFDKEALEGLGEVLVGVGLLAIGIALLLRKPKPADTTIVIHNAYIVNE